MRRIARVSVLSVPSMDDADRYLAMYLKIKDDHEAARMALQRKQDMLLISLHDSLQRPIADDDFLKMLD